MPKLNSRSDLKQYCLTRLGSPVIKINVTDDQIEQRIDDAFELYYDFHYDGVERYYWKHVLTQPEIDNKKITLNDPLVVSLNRCFPIETQSMGIFNVKYQIMLHDFYNFSNVSMTNYSLSMDHLALLDFFFSTKKQFRFNRHQNVVNLDFDFDTTVQAGMYLIFEGTRQIDPEVSTDMYNDRWLRDYATQCIKEQWGENLKKFGDIQLPGGVKLDGKTIYDEAVAAKQELASTLKAELEEPPYFIVG